MTDQGTAQAEQQMPRPSAILRRLERLVGKWNVTGGAQGQVSYEWLEGGFFLLQRFDLVQGGHAVKGIEVIGHVAPFGGNPSEDIKSRIYDNMGNTFDYVYELEGNVLTIWGGERGSPAYYRGVFSADGSVLSGAWVYPGGGGYESTSIRVS